MLLLLLHPLEVLLQAGQLGLVVAGLESGGKRVNTKVKVQTARVRVRSKYGQQGKELKKGHVACCRVKVK